MNSIFTFILAIMFLLPVACCSQAPISDADRAQWVDYKPNIEAEAVKRTNDRYPLSDQKNTGKWSKYFVMSDEFNTKTLNSSKWYPTNPSWKGRQPGWFDPNNVAVKDGCLQLTMRKAEPADMPKDEGFHTYTSAAVQSKTATRYGYYEVRAKAMKSAGSSSFWFYKTDPDRWTEIDVFEISGKAGFNRSMHITAHVLKTPQSDKASSAGSVFIAPASLAEDFHVYGFEWNNKELKFYFDGVLVREGPNTHWMQSLWLNFDSETMPGWFGLPEDEDLPSVYYVDYVRAWKQNLKK